jgi:hypothetical protein
MRRSLLINRLAVYQVYQPASIRFGKDQMKTLPSVYFLQIKERHDGNGRSGH